MRYPHGWLPDFIITQLSSIHQEIPTPSRHSAKEYFLLVVLELFLLLYFYSQHFYHVFYLLIIIGRTDAEAEAPILWPSDVKNWLNGKDPDAGKDWRQEEKGTTEDEMAGWHHWLDGLEFEWTPGGGDGQGGLACCDSWGRKESDMTEQLN